MYEIKTDVGRVFSDREDAAARCFSGRTAEVFNSKTLDIKKFSDNWSCPKCGSTVDIRYHPNGEGVFGEALPPREHLEKYCRCGYSWKEHTKDYISIETKPIG